MVSASYGMNLAIEKAEKTGIAIVNVTNSTHFGAAGYYSNMAAKRGMIGIAMSNVDPKYDPPRRKVSDYCTHSVGPLLHITGLRPKTVTGFEGIYNERMARMGARAGHMALEIVRLENGALIKSIHGVGPSRNSVWYSIYGSKGRIESAREDAMAGDNNHVYEHLDDTVSAPASYEHVDELTEQGKKSGHGGSDMKRLALRGREHPRR